MMKVEKDFEEFIELLNKHEVKYVIVGAFSLALYAEPRNTGDIYIFIENSTNNAKKVLIVLKEFGFSALDINISDLVSDDMVVQLGMPPVRIDIISGISGVSFIEAFETKVMHKFGKASANFLSKEMLIKNKKATGRKKDLADLEALKK